MKKIFILLLLVCSLTFLSSCRGTSDFYYSLEGNISSYEYEGKTFITLRLFMHRGGKRTGVGFAELDDGAFSYEGESIYRYIVYCNDKELYRYNYDDHTINTSYGDLSGAIWSDLKPLETELEVTEKGKYKVLVESNFLYLYTGREHHYTMTLELEIK